MKLTNEEIHKAIIQSGYVTESDLNEAEKISHDQNRSILDILVERGIILENFLGQILAKQLGFPYADLKNKSIENTLAKIVPENIAIEKRLIPFDLKQNILSLAMENPHDIETIEFFKKKTGYDVEVYFILPSVLNTALDTYRKNIKSNFETEISTNAGVAEKITTVSAKDTPIVKILDNLLDYAASEKASDIHIENVGDRIIIRFRIDGKLKDIMNLPTKIQAGIITRIKILSNLRTDEHRIPQDGRFRFNHRDEEISIRVSLLPTYHGEDAVLRLLSIAARPKTLEDLGLIGKNLKIVKQHLKSPKGMILSTGPTGSGKTTTLYNILTLLNKSDVNICTIEDPIEYGLTRVNQIQVNALAGLTFANGLRSILRHDPDIVLVGEIRDKETAEIAVHSALTGHLVLSSIHANNAVGVIPRLLDLSVQPYLIGSSLNLIIAQRLVAKNDPNCLEQTTIDKNMINTLEKEYGIKIPKSFAQDPKQYRSKGCKMCNNEGFKGRIGIFEILPIDDVVKEMIFAKASIPEIEKAAKIGGFATMLEDGLSKVQAGLTTIEEVVRAVRD